MNLKRIGLIVTAVLALGGCQNHEKSITGSYGNTVVTGQVTMAADVANGTPAGVQVTVGGTGMSAILGADGRFTFTGVPDGAVLHLRRATDGIEATTTAVAGFNAIELSKTTVTSSRRRASSPGVEIEGTLTKVAADSITVATESHGSFVVALTPTTIIRKGETTVAPADLKVGDQVHVKATFANSTYTATEVIVQTGDNSGNGAQTNVEIEGTLTKVATGSITVATQSQGSFTVALTTTTIIRKGQTTVAPADLKVGDQVHVKATFASNTYTATEVIVQNQGDGSGSGNGSQTATANGIVKSMGATDMVVHRENGQDVTVQVDSNTTIKKYGNTISFADIKTGDQVECLGTAVDAQTIHATQIEVQDAPGAHGGH
jgi:archaellum component FlaF (FlaF/FlaG flagellin family)